VLILPFPLFDDEEEDEDEDEEDSGETMDDGEGVGDKLKRLISSSGGRTRPRQPSTRIFRSSTDKLL